MPALLRLGPVWVGVCFGCHVSVGCVENSLLGCGCCLMLGVHCCIHESLDSGGSRLDVWPGSCCSDAEPVVVAWGVVAVAVALVGCCFVVL